MRKQDWKNKRSKSHPNGKIVVRNRPRNEWDSWWRGSTRAGLILFLEKRFTGINIKRYSKLKRLKFNIHLKKHNDVVEILQENHIPMSTTKTIKWPLRDLRQQKKVVAHKKVYKLHLAGRKIGLRKMIPFSTLKRIGEHNQNLSHIKNLCRRNSLSKWPSILLMCYLHRRQRVYLPRLLNTMARQWS